jgi:myo-inositol-1(or 4)-monophosphatase
VAGNPKIFAQLVPLLAPYSRAITEGSEDGKVNSTEASGETTPEQALAAAIEVAAPATAPKRTAVRIRK